MTVSPEQCAAILHDLRTAAGLSRSEMAERMGVSDRTYARYEAGDSLQLLSSFLSMITSLPVNAMPTIMRHMYPERFETYSAASDPESCRSQLLTFFSDVASPQDLLQWAYVLFGPHGSMPAAQLQLFCLIDHLPILERLLIAKTGLNLFEIESARDGLTNQEHVLPDLDALRDRIIAVQQSL